VSAETINADVMSIAMTKLDVPACSPVLYVTRDSHGTEPTDAAPTCDVWVAKPERKRVGTRNIVFSNMTPDVYLGAFRPEAVREALGFVPDGGDCIAIDNPRVN
jgi:hypothetical protein